MVEEQGGTKANCEGARLENQVLSLLDSYDYKKQTQKSFVLACNLGQPIFAKQFSLGKGIYDTECKSDFVIYHPQKHPETLVIECKWQNSAGSVDEKFPYMVTNIKERFHRKTIVIIGGKGAKSGAINWLKNQVDQKYLIGVFSMDEFMSWAASGNL